MQVRYKFDDFNLLAWFYGYSRRFPCLYFEIIMWEVEFLRQVTRTINKIIFSVTVYQWTWPPSTWWRDNENKVKDTILSLGSGRINHFVEFVSEFTLICDDSVLLREQGLIRRNTAQPLHIMRHAYVWSISSIWDLEGSSCQCSLIAPWFMLDLSEYNIQIKIIIIQIECVSRCLTIC